MSLSPIQTLRVIRAVLSDTDLTAAQRIVVVAVVVAADNRTGIAWESYRHLGTTYGLSSSTIAQVLGPALSTGPAAKYVEVAGHGRQGSRSFRVKAAEVRSPLQSEAQPSAEGFAEQSAALPSTKRSASDREDILTLTADPTSGPNKLRSGVTRWTETDVERVYQAYPRKVGRKAAIQSIFNALNAIAGRDNPPLDPVAWLLGRVEVFAKARAGEDSQFTPYPRTWFSQGRYDDDAKEWQSRTNRQAGGVGRIEGKPGKYDHLPGGTRAAVAQVTR